MWCSAADTLLKLLDRAVSGGSFQTLGVFECDISHRRSVSVQCMLYDIRRNATHAPSKWCSTWTVCVSVGYLHAVRWSHSGILICNLDAEPRSTAGLLLPSQCPSGTILLALYSTVWDSRISRAGPMLLYWPKLLYPYYSLLLFFPFSSSCV